MMIQHPQESFKDPQHIRYFRDYISSLMLINTFSYNNRDQL